MAKSKRSAELPAKIKLPFIKKISSEPLVSEVLARLEPSNYMQNYIHYPEGFH